MNTKKRLTVAIITILTGLVGAGAEAKTYTRTLKPISLSATTLENYRFDHKNIPVKSDPGPVMLDHQCLNCDSDAPVIRIVFNEPVVEPGLEALKIFSYDLSVPPSEDADAMSPPVVLDVKYGFSQKEILFYLSKPFHSNVNYRFYIPQDLVEDLAGNPMANDIGWHDVF